MFEELSPIEMKKMLNSLEAENIKLKQELIMLLDLSSFYMEENRERKGHCNDLNRE